MKKEINTNILYPKLTIAIPTFNRPEFLKLSLKSAIKQSYKGFYEVIVVDNSNKEEFKKEVDNVINSFSFTKKIKFFRNRENIGMFENWNKCLEQSSGEYTTILNDDDLLDYSFVENVLNDIDGSKMLIYKHKIIFDKKRIKRLGSKIKYILEKIKSKEKEKIKISNLIFRNPSNGSLGVVVKTKDALFIGGYKNVFYPSSDYHFNVNYISKFGGIKISKKLCSYRFSVNESLNLICLRGFVEKDFALREIIFERAFKKNFYLLKISNKLNSFQAIAQCARYIYLRNLSISDFNDLNLGTFRKNQAFLFSLISSSQYFSIFAEILILILWKLLFLCNKTSLKFKNLFLNFKLLKFRNKIVNFIMNLFKHLIT